MRVSHPQQNTNPADVPANAAPAPQLNPHATLNQNVPCTICHDSHHFEAHTNDTCPARGKCLVCCGVRSVAHDRVNHNTEFHNFKPSNFWKNRPNNGYRPRNNYNSYQNQQRPSPQNLPATGTHQLNFVNDSHYDNFCNAATFFRKQVAVGKERTYFIISADRRYYLLEL